MSSKIIKKVIHDLEDLSRFNIPINRSLDILEATTKNLNEIIIINTFRESLVEIKESRI